MNTLLVINVSPQLEEDLVDYLLELDCVSGFTSLPVRGHGSRGVMSLAEQVSGRKQRMTVQILLDAADVDTVIAGLASSVGRDIVWWTQSIERSGRID
jgi:hypothetical protein